MVTKEESIKIVEEYFEKLEFKRPLYTSWKKKIIFSILWCFKKIWHLNLYQEDIKYIENLLINYWSIKPDSYKIEKRNLYVLSSEKVDIFWVVKWEAKIERDRFRTFIDIGGLGPYLVHTETKFLYKKATIGTIEMEIKHYKECKKNDEDFNHYFHNLNSNINSK